ncbi:peptidase MA family metallohydrolase [Bacteroidota bacterium]
MKIRSRKKLLFLAFFLPVVLYLFWGPLFPWNPLKFGFKKIASSKANVYITDFNGESVVYKLNELIQEEEEFHALKFKEKFRIIILGKESNMKRYLPWMKGSGYSVKLGFINVIYIGANARNSQYGMDVFLKHEISHLLIHQNTSSSGNNFEILKQGWLTEGVATYFGGPYYYEKNEFIKLWMENKLTFDNLYEENPLEMDGSIFKLKYTYYRFFIEFLINTYGLEKFHSYLKRYIYTPQNYKIIFTEVYEEDLNEILKNFNYYMIQ